MRRHEQKVLFGGGDGFIGTQAILPPKIYFLLGFVPFYFENIKICKIVICVKKKIPTEIS